MSQVIMMLLFPIGLYFYFFKERPYRVKYNKIFTNFEREIQNNITLNNSKKLGYFKDMLLKNDYKIKEINPNKVIGEKRVFSMSLFAMSVGFYYIGALFYMLYFYYMQKPHRVVFKIEE